MAILFKIVNLIINLHKRKTCKNESKEDEKRNFPNCENMMPTTKLEVSISKTKGLKGPHESRVG